MPLKQMLNFIPSDEDMFGLDLDVVVYVKVVIISENIDNNYNFIRFLFSEKDINEYFKDSEKTIFYDFTLSEEKHLSIFELYARYNFHNTGEYLKQILEEYTQDSDVIIDLFTHDQKKYRLSNLDGIVLLEQLNN